MKKEKKISLLQECIDSKNIARIYTGYEPNYYYFYPNEVNDTFMLGQEEDDFQLDGYHIRKISHITKVEIKDDVCREINIWNGVADQVCSPEIDISSWYSIFTALQNRKGFLIIEDEEHGQYAIGRIAKVCKRHLNFRPFGADGVWDEGTLTIPYSTITHVAWNTRYADNWERFLTGRA